MQHWNENHSKHNDKQVLDYIQMNKNGAKKGLTDAKEFYSYRKGNPVYIKKVQSDRKSNRKLPSDKDLKFTYGKPTR